MTPQTASMADIDTEEVLEELLNISVGRAVAETEDLFRFTTTFSVPKAREATDESLGSIISEGFNPGTAMWLIEQEFYDGISGSTYLAGISEELGKASLFCDQSQGIPSNHADALTRHATLELGSVLMASCIGAFAEMARRIVRFGYPKFLECISPWTGSSGTADNPESFITIQTSLTVDQYPVLLNLVVVLTRQISDAISKSLLKDV